MYKIKYYNKELVNYEAKEVEIENKSVNSLNGELTEIKTKVLHEPIFELRELEYKTKDEEFEYWLDVIKKSYGQYGEVTFEHLEDELTKEELEKEELKAEIKSLKEQLLEVQNYVVEGEYNNLLENGGMKDVI